MTDLIPTPYQDYVTKAEFSEFKHEMHAFRSEFNDFKEEMYAFRDEMYAFREEMREFKNEMYAFREAVFGLYEDQKNIMNAMMETLKQINATLADIKSDLSIKDKRLDINDEEHKVFNRKFHTLGVA